MEALPPEDQQRLRQWLEEKQKLASQTANGASSAGSFREREMRWLAEHEAEYAGQ